MGSVVVTLFKVEGYLEFCRVSFLIKPLLLDWKEVKMAAIRCLHSLSRSVQLLRTTFQVNFKPELRQGWAHKTMEEMGDIIPIL